MPVATGGVVGAGTGVGGAGGVFGAGAGTCVGIAVGNGFAVGGMLVDVAGIAVAVGFGGKAVAVTAGVAIVPFCDGIIVGAVAGACFTVNA